MLPVLTSKQMYEAECNAVSRGITFSRLMENAGTACAGIIFSEIFSGETKTAVILSGKGKNGGDGYVIARVLSEKGWNVNVILTDGEPKDDISLENYYLLPAAGVNVTEYTAIEDIMHLISSADVIVDAIFGTGFRGQLDSRLSLLADASAASGAVLVSIDVPSGTICDSAACEGNCFRPDYTIAISAYKPIHIIKPNNKICGKVIIADIGIIKEDFDKINSVICYTENEKSIGAMLPERKSNSNKGTYGHALCICGSMKMVGAAELSVKGALRSGAGLVTAAFPQSAYPAIAPKLTENLMLPLDSNIEGTFAFSAYSGINEAMKRSNAVLAGCGIGFNPDTSRIIESLIKDASCPLILDADALNIVSKNPEMLKNAKIPVIVTPHPGEMSRLCGKSVQEVVSDPVRTAYNFTAEYGCITVLKGANTVICAPKSKRIYINTTGNSGLSKGGSGDLLAGIMVSLLAQGISPYKAALIAVFIHGRCADEVAKKSSMRGMLPSDIINYLPVYLGRFE